MSKLKSGDILGDYRILNQLGSGGMGSVFMAYDPALKRNVALKVLNPKLQEDNDNIKRFEHEARIIAGLSHPNLMHIYAVGKSESYNYFAMEYIKGESLQNYLRIHDGKIPEEDALRITIELMAALQKTHENDIIHRDLKPANVMLHEDDKRAILVDFGLSKDVATDHDLTSDNSILGTPDYMSPEQIEGETITPATDIYSLGIMLYQMLSGVKPFKRKTTIQTLRAHCEESAPRLTPSKTGISEKLVVIIEKMMQRDSNARFQSINELALALLEVHSHPLLIKIAENKSYKITQNAPREEHTSNTTVISLAKTILETKAFPLKALTLGGSLIALVIIAFYYINHNDKKNVITPENRNKTAETTTYPSTRKIITYKSSANNKAPAIPNPKVLLLLKAGKKQPGTLESIKNGLITIRLRPAGKAEYNFKDLRGIVSLESIAFKGKNLPFNLLDNRGKIHNPQNRFMHRKTR